MTKSLTKTNGNGHFTGVTEFWEHAALRFWLDFWHDAEPISQFQGKVLENWCHGVAQKLILAPLKLWQEILPGWVFGSQENVYLTTDWGAEQRICAKAAGYGSQLGTIQDCLSVYRKTVHLPEETLKSDDRKALHKFDDLVEKVARLKKPVSKGASETLRTAAVNPVVGRNIRPVKPPKPRKSTKQRLS